MDNLIGRMCQARYNGGYVIGKIIKNDFKSGYCTIETRVIGTIKARASRVTMIDKELF